MILICRETGTRIKISGRKGLRYNRISMAEQYEDPERERRKTGGKHYPYMHLERVGAEDPLSDGTDIRFYETAV